MRDGCDEIEAPDPLAPLALRASEDRFRDVIENMQDFVVLTDLDGTVALVNPSTVSMLGYAGEEEILGRNVADTICFSREECARVRSKLDILGSLAREEVLFRHRDGSRVVVEANLCLARDPDGQPCGLECVGRDVTVPRRAEAALRMREVQFRTLFERSRDALMTLAPPSWRFTSGNPAALALFAARGELDFTSRGPWEYSPELQPDGRRSDEKAAVMIETAMREGSHFFSWTHRRLSGECFPATVLLTRMEIEGQPLLQATVRDETERRRHEDELRRARDEAEAATRAKSEFLANMSHEIRTPMNAIVGLTHLLLKTELSPRQKSLLDKIQASAHGMVGLISDILDFSKIETGKLEMEAIELDLARVLENVASALVAKAADKRLDLRFEMAADVPRRLVGDPLRLGQILLNLAGNSVKFTDTGEVVVSVTLAARAGRTARLCFAVRDTGPGIPLDRQKGIFQPFVQADGSVTRRFGGTGLGLAISKQLVEIMGGTFTLDSRPGVGSTFSFTISMGLPAEAGQPHPLPLLADGSQLRVLVVDDSLTGREVLRAYLTGMSFDVHTVGSGEEALAELRNARVPYQLVLLDWCMPGMDGPEVAHRIKRDLELANVPRILLVTALDAVEEVGETQSLDIDGFLYKPVSESALLDAIMIAMRRDPRAAGGEAAMPKARGPGHASPDLAGKRILVVEDNLINQEVAHGVLEDFGLRVVLAGNGQQALDILARDAAFDAILMDVQMPVMDGHSATRAIRAQPGTATIPIVALTADAMSSERARCLEDGMDAYVTKPIVPDHLREILERVLESRPSRLVSTATAPGLAPNDLAKAREPGLPEQMPGLDLGAGVRRLMGNSALYTRLLRSFAGEHAGDAEQIRAAVGRGDLAGARAVAHKLKGVAGNLSAKEVSASAARVDAILRDGGHAALAAQLDELHGSLQVVNASISSLRGLAGPALATVGEPGLACRETEPG